MNSVLFVKPGVSVKLAIEAAILPVEKASICFTVPIISFVQQTVFFES